MQDKTSILQRELDELWAQITALERALGEKPDCGLGKGAPAVTRWELDRALLKQLKEQAAGIEHLLSTKAEGEYGTCEQCGRSIHPDRLTVLPGTKMCIRCARVGESPSIQRQQTIIDYV